MHFVNSAIGLASWLLYDDRPVQRRDRAVGAQHFLAVLAVADRELLGRGQLSLIAGVHKVPHDFQVLHVLPGDKCRCGRGYQAPLGVDDVRS